MKKNNIYRAVTACTFASAVLFSMPSCTDGFHEANRPGTGASAEDLNRDNYMTSSFIVQMENEAFPEQENTYQMNQDLIGNYLSRYMTYANNGFAEKNFARLNAPNGWVRYPFKDSMPKTVSAFKEIARVTNGQGLNYAWALILRAQSFMRLTDMYGPIPIGADPNDGNAYSSQEDVYKSLIADLNKATEIISPLVAANPDLTASAEHDKVYQGKFAKWLKYANSLKLRIAIRIRFVAPALAKQLGEQAVQDGVITSNEDNCTIAYIPNGQYKTSVEWGDSRACADLECYLAGYNDPRLAKFFKPTEEAGPRAIIGCRAAAKIGNKTTADKAYSAANINQNSEGVWLTASEMAFCRAEGALAGWSNMGGTAQSLYEEGVRLSFEQWGAGDATSYLADNTSTEADYVDPISEYGGNVSAVSNITIKWDDAATDDQKLERLATQKWIAMFPNGQEGWCEIRRTGYPKVFPLAQPTDYSIQVANRIPFDIDEATNNKDNYLKAVQLLNGADDYATKMWWQRR